MNDESQNQSWKDFLLSKVPNALDEVIGDGPFEVEKDGYVATITNEGKIIDIKKAGLRIKVSNIKVVLNPDGSGDNLGEKSISEGTPLYIVFDSKLEGGEVTCDKTLPYQVTKNGDVEFNLTGKVGEQPFTKKVTVTVNQFKVELKIGTYVKYNVSYKDIYTEHEFTTQEGKGWRILYPGDNNGDGTYSNVKIISTGIPAKLHYAWNSMPTTSWRGTEKQLETYQTTFYQTTASQNNSLYAASGLYYNFANIPFVKGTSANTGVGFFSEINGSSTNAITGNDFLKGNATDVHDLTMFDLNTARNKKVGTVKFGVNQPDKDSTATINTYNDAATGLFYLNNLNEFGYPSANSFNYCLASNISASTSDIWMINEKGEFTLAYNNSYGIRPVITLSSISDSDIEGN